MHYFDACFWFPMVWAVVWREMDDIRWNGPVYHAGGVRASQHLDIKFNCDHCANLFAGVVVYKDERRIRCTGRANCLSDCLLYSSSAIDECEHVRPGALWPCLDHRWIQHDLANNHWFRAWLLAKTKSLIIGLLNEVFVVI